MASPDGYSWASKTSGTSYRLNGVTHGNSVFVAVGYDIAQHCGLLLTSPDGVLWSSRLSGITNMLHPALHANDIFGGLFVAVGDNGLILASQDGIQWSIVNADPRYSLEGSFTVAGFLSPAGADAILTSQDGIRWTRTSTAAGGNLLAFGNGVFVTLGAVSSDGVDWTPVDAPSKENFELNDMTFGNGLFVAVGGTLHVGFAPPSPIHIITTSPDGIHWTTRSTEGPPLRGVAYENGAFMAVGHNGAVLTSPDGINWFPKGPGHSQPECGGLLSREWSFCRCGRGGHNPAVLLTEFEKRLRSDTLERPPPACPRCGIQRPTISGGFPVCSRCLGAGSQEHIHGAGGESIYQLYACCVVIGRDAPCAGYKSMRVSSTEICFSTLP